MPTADIQGTEIFYETAGEGEPVVLLNGVMMTTQAWAPQTRALAGRHRCVLHDFRGQLRSGKPDGPLRMERHAEDLDALLDLLGIGSAHLVGASYGGEVGMMYAHAHPERVRSLAVIGSVSRPGPLLLEQVAVWADAARRDPGRLYEVTAPYNFSAGFLARNPDLVRQGAERLRAYPADFFSALARLVEAFAELNLDDRLPGIRCPTLVLCGEEDALKPVPYSRAIAERIPGAELVVVPGAGHAVAIEQADAVNAALLDFLARHADGSPPPRT